MLRGVLSKILGRQDPRALKCRRCAIDSLSVPLLWWVIPQIPAELVSEVGKALGTNPVIAVFGRVPALAIALVARELYSAELAVIVFPLRSVRAIGPCDQLDAA